MKKYYLKTNTEQDIWEALETAGLAVRHYDMEDENNIRPEDADENWYPTGDYEWEFTGNALDMIGKIYVETGEMMLNGNSEEEIYYPETVAVEGYHANLIAEEGIEGLPEIDPPSNPNRKWAGEDEWLS